MPLIFGYGSLINKKSISNSIPGERELYPTRIYGYKRGWYASDNNVTWLGIKKRSGYTVNGVIFFVTDEEMSILDKRESIYKRLKVKSYSVLSDKYPFDKNNIIYTYIFEGKRNDSPIFSTYINMCLEGTIEQDRIMGFGYPKFTREFLETTYSWPKNNWVP